MQIYLDLQIESSNINELQPGDLLCCDGHVEFYYGYRYKTIRDEEGNDILTNELEKVPVVNGRYKSLFGWGEVYSSFPNSNRYFYKSGNVFKRDGDSRNYDTVYRKEYDELNVNEVRGMLNNE